MIHRLFKEYWIVVLAVLAVTNLVAFALMGIDKKKAAKHAWRIPEKTLFLSALLLGGIGANCGMQFFRHKTKHWYFVVFMPVILILQIALFAWIYFG